MLANQAYYEKIEMISKAIFSEVVDAEVRDDALVMRLAAQYGYSFAEIDEAIANILYENDDLT